MDHATAKARLERMVQAERRPALDATEVSELLELALRPDSEQRWPDAAGYVPTFDLAWAAAEGWRWKAAKVATDTAYSADGSSFARDQAHKGALTMAALYDKQAGPPPSDYSPVTASGDLSSVGMVSPTLRGSTERTGIVNLAEAP